MAGWEIPELNAQWMFLGKFWDFTNGLLSQSRLTTGVYPATNDSPAVPGPFSKFVALSLPSLMRVVDDFFIVHFIPMGFQIPKIQGGTPKWMVSS